MYDTTIAAKLLGQLNSSDVQRPTLGRWNTPDDGGQKPPNPYPVHGNASAFPQPDFHFTRNENRHFTLCLQGATFFLLEKKWGISKK